jgi:DNA-binding NtrC family response regulator
MEAPTFVGSSAAMESVMDLAERVAKSEASVLILGESGTGKGLLAACIHLRGNRRERPFVTVPCANIPAELFESELFGHERGSHTDAHARKSGKFEAAHGGTLFLDGLEALSPLVQAKLLRVLQEKAFERLGGVETLKVDVRVISAGHEGLDADVATGLFREDLFYRLNVLQIRIPPLRERPEDVMPLARHFLKLHRARTRSGPERFSTAARRLLVSHSWPGNVREVINAVEAGAIRANGTVIEPEHLQLSGSAPGSALIAGAAARSLTLADLEEAYIREILSRTRGNKTRAAAILGISRKTLLLKIRKYEAHGEPVGPARSGGG